MNPMMGQQMEWDKEPVVGAEREKIAATFKHLPLNPGDKVRWKGAEYKNKKAPKLNQVVEVFNTFPVRPDTSSRGLPCDADLFDFSVLFRDSDDGELMEFMFDSRRFDLVK